MRPELDQRSSGGGLRELDLWLDSPLMDAIFHRSSWPAPDAPFEERHAWAETVSLEERMRWAAEHARPRTDDDTPILAGSGGRRATPEELRAFVAREQERIARGG